MRYPTQAAGAPANAGEPQVFDDLAERHTIGGSAMVAFGALSRGEHHGI